MIYFNQDKQAFAFEIEDYICAVEDEEWQEYSVLNLGEEYDITSDGIVDLRNTEEYIEKQAQKEREYINSLTMTKRAMALRLQSLGISYTQLKELISKNEQAQLEWDLCERLERSNPLLDIMGEQLGIFPKQIDEMFMLENGLISSSLETVQKENTGSEAE